MCDIKRILAWIIWFNLSCSTHIMWNTFPEAYRNLTHIMANVCMNAKFQNRTICWKLNDCCMSKILSFISHLCHRLCIVFARNHGVYKCVGGSIKPFTCFHIIVSSAVLRLVWYAMKFQSFQPIDCHTQNSASILIQHLFFYRIFFT